MSIEFRAEKEYLTMHDPMQGGALIDRQTEIRFDPLTGETSRLLFDPGAPFTPPDYTEAARATEGSTCPFCSGQVTSGTPTFPDSVCAAGRFLRGEAVVFPNLFPYSKHNAVVRMTDQHYVRLEQFTPQQMNDAFLAAYAYVQHLIESDDQLKAVSLNWNYLPLSGGSILHPHLHVLGTEHPTFRQRTMLLSEEQYYGRTGRRYWDDLMKEEERLQERWVGRHGTMRWAHAYAPRGHCDFVGVFDHAASFGQLTEQDWESLAGSLRRLFGYFARAGFASFNMSVYGTPAPTEAGRVHVRIVPRVTMGKLGTSDMSVFQTLHSESFCLKIPEQVAREAAGFFG